MKRPEPFMGEKYWVLGRKIWLGIWSETEILRLDLGLLELVRKINNSYKNGLQFK